MNTCTLREGEIWGIRERPFDFYGVGGREFFEKKNSLDWPWQLKGFQNGSQEEKRKPGSSLMKQRKGKVEKLKVQEKIEKKRESEH